MRPAVNERCVCVLLFYLCSMYASLCECIARTPIPGLGEDPTGRDASKGSKKFRKMLLIKVQEEFLKDWQGLFVAVQVRATRCSSRATAVVVEGWCRGFVCCRKLVLALLKRNASATAKTQSLCMRANCTQSVLCACFFLWVLPRLGCELRPFFWEGNIFIAVTAWE